MKKYFSLIIVFISIVSCSEELLDAFTPGVITEELATRDSIELQKILNTGLNFLTNREEYAFTSVFTDEAVPGFNNGGQGIAGTTNYYNFQLESNSVVAGAIWRSCYYALAYFNLILANIDNVVPKNDADAILLNRIKAEALTMRAFAHSKILAYYSPNLTDDNALAGMLSLEYYPSITQLPRVSNAVFYASIHSDLDAAIALYPDSSIAIPERPAASKTFYPTIDVARALKARVYAYKKDYVNAEIFANQVITTSGIQIAPRANLVNVFHNHNEVANTEVIFRLKRTIQQNAQGTNLHNAWVSVANRRNGSPFFEVARGLFNVLNPSNHHDTANDGRAFLVTRPGIPNLLPPNSNNVVASLVDPDYTTSPNVRESDILVPFKHGGAVAATATNGFNPDFIQFRISEMYLIRAEARAYADDYTSVANNLKEITDRRFTTPPAALTLTSRQQALRAVLDERRKELCFEGHRYIDLKRLYVDAGVTAFDRHPVDYVGLNFPGANPANFPFAGNTRWALPIPLTELNANSNMVQNPGY